MTDNQHRYCIIMAGGIGSRFWPISREARPKQFLDFAFSGKSFLRLAYDRVAGIVPEENIIIVTMARYREQVKQHIPTIREENILEEPYNRNTAPCIAYAAHVLLKRDPQAVMAVLPADHVISDRELYRQSFSAAFDYAKDNPVLLTLGITPTRPDANFGYIQAPGADAAKGLPVVVKTFTEKPDAELAKVFLESGEFFWNSGIFFWQASVICEELKRHAPEIASLWKGWEKSLCTPDERSFIEGIYPDMARTSIDYAVMEKSDIVRMLPVKFGWADIGNWESFYEYLANHDANGNAIRVEGKSLLRDDKGNIIYSGRPDRLTAIKGLENFIVVDTDDVLMICPRNEKKIKDFITELSSPDFKDYR